MLLGMLRSDQRRILINGHDVAKAAPNLWRGALDRLGVLLPGTDCHREPTGRGWVARFAGCGGGPRGEPGYRRPTAQSLRASPTWSP
jgi:hypothetical protein